ncbi:putative Rab GTPase-activating protein 1-like [Trypoxylus dichotomus]
MQKIGEMVNGEDYTNICATVRRSYSRINGLLKDKHRKKLESLPRQGESNSVDPSNTVINLSSKQWDNNAIKISTKGMKFAIAPTRVPTLDMILVVEMAAEKTQPSEVVDEYRWNFRTAIEKAKPKQIRQNISKAEQRSLKELLSDKNIKIFPADKGNATESEMADTLSSNNITELKKSIKSLADKINVYMNERDANFVTLEKRIDLIDNIHERISDIERSVNSVGRAKGLDCFPKGLLRYVWNNDIGRGANPTVSSLSNFGEDRVYDIDFFVSVQAF